MRPLSIGLALALHLYDLTMLANHQCGIERSKLVKIASLMLDREQELRMGLDCVSDAQVVCRIVMEMVSEILGAIKHIAVALLAYLFAQDSEQRERTLFRMQNCRAALHLCHASLNLNTPLLTHA
jgi:hypothetical protein